MKLQTVLSLFFCLSFFLAKGQTAHQFLRKADQEYKNENFQIAEENYRRALEKDKNSPSTYNLGNAIYQQKRYDEAAEKYQHAASDNKNPVLKSKAYHNLGNALFQNKKIEESIEAYKKALWLNPKDLETKRNLALAKRTLKQMEQKKDKPEPPKDQDQKQQQEPENQQQQTPQEQNPKPDNQQPQEQAKDLNKKEAEKLLEIMDREEQKVQEKLKKSKDGPRKPEKDW